MSVDIFAFAGENEVFSNFHREPVYVWGCTWPTAEHAFQAAKFFGTNRTQVEKILNAHSPREAKKLGNDRMVPIRRDWEEIKVPVMTAVQMCKYQVPGLAEVLASTDGLLVEGNRHGDDTWGAVWVPASTPVGEGRVWADVEGMLLVGRNELGKILMVVRRHVQGADVVPRPVLAYQHGL